MGELSWTLFYPDVLTEPEAAAFPRVAEAARLLAAGQAAKAEAALPGAPAGGTEAGLRDALLAIIAVGRKDAAAAMRLAERAVAEAPGSAMPQLALSYARQLGPISTAPSPRQRRRPGWRRGSRCRSAAGRDPPDARRDAGRTSGGE